MRGLRGRRSIRLRGYDYTSPGAYFVTICTHRKRWIFGAIVDGKMSLALEGQIAKVAWMAIVTHFSEVETGPFVVMPNHVHGILILEGSPGKRRGTACRAPTSFGKPVAGSLETILRSFESAVTRGANHLRPVRQTVWQRGFFERVIRGEEEFARIAGYIEDNPRRWIEDQYYTSED